MIQVSYAGKTFKATWWNGDTLPVDLLAVDTETTTIQGNETPDLRLVQVCDGYQVILIRPEQAVRFFCQHTNQTLVFHNFPFDNKVLAKAGIPELARNLDSQPVWDTGLLWRLGRLKTHGQVPMRWSLDFIAAALHNETLPKDEELRLGWEADDLLNLTKLQYAAMDAAATFCIFKSLEWVTQERNALTHDIQLKGAIALDDITQRGIGFDIASKDAFLQSIDGVIDESESVLEKHGYRKGVPGNTKILQGHLQRASEKYDVALPTTKKGLSSKAAYLKAFSTDEFFHSWLQFQEYQKLRAFFVLLTSGRIHPRYDTLKNTGRTGSFQPNIQNLPRRDGVRDCFVPAPGQVFIACDYSTLELCTLAQHCYTKYGFSVMREHINNGIDLHKWFAARIANKDIKDVTKTERQGAKAANFGYPGGLGARKFRDYARTTYGVEFTEEEAINLKKEWIAAFPEMEYHLRDTIADLPLWDNNPFGDKGVAQGVAKRILSGVFVSKTGNPYSQEIKSWAWNIVAPSLLGHKPKKLPCPELADECFSEMAEVITGRLRGKTRYNAARNTPFQGLAADGAKLALFRLYLEGFRVVAFVHDEVIVEVPVDRIDDCASRISTIMIEEMSKVCPDVKISTEYVAMCRWYKGAKEIRNNAGKLLPYTKGDISCLL